MGAMRHVNGGRVETEPGVISHSRQTMLRNLNMHKILIKFI